MTSHQNRELRTLALGELTLFHRNPRRGDIPAIKTSLQANTLYKPLVVNRGTLTGRPWEVLAGNHTLMALKELWSEDPDNDQWAAADCYIIDVDNTQAERIVLVDNKTAQLGGFDDAELALLLSGFGDDLAGTGYTSDELSDLTALLEETMPDPFAEPEPVDQPSDVSGGDKPGPRVGEDGLIRSNDLNQDRDAYADKGTRIVVLDYPIDIFIWVQDKLAAARDRYGVETNTAAVLELLAERFGERPPVAESAEDTETEQAAV